MKPIRSATTAAVIGATTASIVTALIIGQTLQTPEPTPTATVAPVTETAPPTAPESPAPPVPVPSADPAPVPEPEPTPTPTPEPTIETLGGTMRWVNRASWGLIDNATHTPYGVSRVEVRKDRVRIHFDFKASQVRDFTVGVDEGYASANVRVGASVGLSYTDVFFYMGASSKPVNPTQLSKAGANVWFSGSFIVPPPAS